MCYGSVRSDYDFCFSTIDHVENQPPIWINHNDFHHLIPKVFMRLATPDAKFLTDALKRHLDFIFAQDWCLALFGTRIAAVAVPDIVTLRVFAVVPDFVPIKAAAVCTNQLIAKRAIIPKPCLVSSPVLQPLLNKVENLWRNNWFVRILNVVLWQFAVIFPRFLAEIVNCVALLQQSFSLILLVSEEFLH